MSKSIPDAAMVNGRVSSEPWVLDRGLHFGDGVFETLSCRAGRARFINLHLDRLTEGCLRLQLPPVDVTLLRAQIEKMASEADSCIIKVIVTRGGALERGYAVTGSEQPTCVMLRYPTQLETLPVRAFSVGIATLRLGENPALAGLKHLNRLEQVLAQMQRKDRCLDELLMFSSSGRLISGTMSNVFLVRNGAVQTPLLDRCGVSGIMRRVVLREARRAGIHCEELALEASALDEAEEMFLSSSRLGVVSVGDVEGRTPMTGAVTRSVQALLAPMLENAVNE